MRPRVPALTSPIDRRTMLRVGATIVTVVAFDPKPSQGDEPHGYDPSKYWWAFAVDTMKCIGCGACVRACRAENAVRDGYFRTWVERYTILRSLEVQVDSPDGALHGFPTDPGVDRSEIEKSFFVPKLCNHCETSPCVQVCPVGASFESPDGVVLIDKDRCVGCGYCVQACPYGCRYLDHSVGTADKCTLCYHRITRGLPTACVQACPVGARIVGNLKDPNSPVRKVLGTSRFGLLKPELGTHPKCFYIGLDKDVK